MPSPFLVIGGTGKTGRRVVSFLEERGFKVRSVSRASATPFDWNDTGTWQKVVEGVEAIYITNPGLGSPEAAEQLRAFAQVSASAGVVKAVLATTPDDGSAFSQLMRTAEKSIVEAGLTLVSLRLRWFYQNFSEDFLLQPVLSGELRLPGGEGREAFVDADDIAEVAVAALTESQHDGRFLELTGPRLLSFSDIAQEISRGAGIPLRYVPLSPDDFVTEQLALGVSPDWAHMLSGIYQDIAKGKLANTTDDVSAVLGKPARDFSDYVSQVAHDRIWSDAKQA